MRLEREKYTFHVVATIEGKVVVFILEKGEDPNDPTQERLVDVAHIEPVVLDEIESKVTFNMTCLFNKALDILTETNIPVEIFTRINQARAEQANTEPNGAPGVVEEKPNETVL